MLAINNSFCGEKWEGIKNRINEQLIQLSVSPATITTNNKQRSGLRQLDAVELTSRLDALLAVLHEAAADFVTFRTLCSLSFRPAYGHCVALMLEVFEQTRFNTEIRLKAADVLAVLFDASPAGEFVAADSAAIILPGSFFRLQRIAIESATAGVSHRICTAAVALISSLIRLTLNCQNAISSDDNRLAKKISSLYVERNKEWMQMATKNIEPMLFLVASRLSANANAAIRRAVARLFRELVSDCRAVFSKELVVDAAVDLCVLLRSDPDQAIRREMDEFEAQLRSNHHNKEILSYLFQKFIRTIKDFSKKLREASDGDHIFQNLVNCVAMAGAESLERLALSFSNVFEKFFAGDLLASICVDQSALLVSDVSHETTRGDKTNLTFFYDLHFRHNVRLAQIVELAKILASSNTVILKLFDAIAAKFSMLPNEEERISAIIFLTTIFASISTESHREADSILELNNILSSFVNFALEIVANIESRLRDHVDDKQIQAFSIAATHSTTTTLISVLLYGMTVCVGLLNTFEYEVSNLTKLEINVLYELLKGSASTNCLIRSAVERSLFDLARGKNFSSVYSFLSAQASHIVFKVALELRDSARYWYAPSLVFTQLLRHANPSVSRLTLTRSDSTTIDASLNDAYQLFEATRHIVDELLYALDRNNQQKTMLILQSIRDYMRAMPVWFPDLRPPPPREYNETNPPTETSDNEDEIEHENGKFEEIGRVMNESRPKQSENFPQIRSVVGILNRTKHMISVCHLPIQNLVVDILDNSLKFVANFNDELLPMVHQNWHGVIAKFTLNDDWSSANRFCVATGAMNVVVTMCRLTKGFVYQKIVNELSPVLCPLMERSMAVFGKSTQSSLNSFHQTALFRFQRTVLLAIPTMVVECDLSDEHAARFRRVLSLFEALSSTSSIDGNSLKASCRAFNELAGTARDSSTYISEYIHNKRASIKDS